MDNEYALTKEKLLQMLETTSDNRFSCRWQLQTRENGDKFVDISVHILLDDNLKNEE